MTITVGHMLLCRDGGEQTVVRVVMEEAIGDVNKGGPVW